MNYNKPEITSSASANFVIQGQTLKSSLPADSKESITAVSAYEADE
jgi:hypothetical protein